VIYLAKLAAHTKRFTGLGDGVGLKKLQNFTGQKFELHRGRAPQFTSLHAATVRHQTLFESRLGLFIGPSYWYRLA
jgi:hypothetical protein